MDPNLEKRGNLNKDEVNRNLKRQIIERAKKKVLRKGGDVSELNEMMNYSN